MDDRPEIADVHNLIKGDFFCLFSLANSTIRENVPLKLEFAENSLDFSQNLLDDTNHSGELQIIDVLGHDCGQATFIMSHTELIVDLAGHELASVGDLAQLHRQGTRSVT